MPQVPLFGDPMPGKHENIESIMAFGVLDRYRAPFLFLFGSSSSDRSVSRFYCAHRRYDLLRSDYRTSAAITPVLR
jgi:hypothetical protein